MMMPIEIAGLRRPIYQWLGDFVQAKWDDYQSIKTMKSSVSIPFQLDPQLGNVPIVRVKLDGSAEAPFVFDTGCDVIVIDRHLVGKHLITKVQQEFASPGGGGTAGEIIHLDTIALGPLCVHNKFAVVTQLDEHSFPFRGVLGASFFRARCFTLDYKKQLITFQTADAASSKSKPVPFAPGVNETGLSDLDLFPSLAGPLVFIEGLLGEHKVTFQVDTGCSNNHISNSYSRNLGGQAVAGEKIIWQGFVGSETKDRIEKFKRLQVGDSTIPNPLFGINNDSVNLSDVAPAVLGTDFLSNFQITFDYVNRQIVLKQNPSP